MTSNLPTPVLRDIVKTQWIRHSRWRSKILKKIPDGEFTVSSICTGKGGLALDRKELHRYIRELEEKEFVTRLDGNNENLDEASYRITPVGAQVRGIIERKLNSR